MRLLARSSCAAFVLLVSLGQALPLRAQGQGGLAAALTVLETAIQQHHQSLSVDVAGIELVCEQLRQVPKPLAGERAWYIATVGLMESGAAPYELRTHLEHARARFKDEPRFLLADGWVQRPLIDNRSKLPDLVTAREFFPNRPTPVSMSPLELSRSSFDPIWRGSEAFNPFPLDNAGRVAPPANASLGMIPNVSPLPPESASAHALWQAREDYKHALHTAAIAAEAELRLGDLDLSQSNPRSALDHFGNALKRTTDLKVQYLAYSLTGMADEALQRWPDAEAAYRKALDAAPNGRAAANALQALLDRQGKHAEAESIRSRAIDAAAVDPWREFTNGDLVPYSALLEELRRAAR